MTRITGPCPCPENCGGTYEREADEPQTSASPLAVLRRRQPRDYLVTISAAFSRERVYPNLVTARSRREACRIAEQAAGLHGTPWKYRARPARPADHAYRIGQETR